MSTERVPEIPEDLRELYSLCDDWNKTNLPIARMSKVLRELGSTKHVRPLIERIASLTAELDAIKRDTDWEENSANHAALNSLRAQHERDQETIAELRKGIEIIDELHAENAQLREENARLNREANAPDAQLSLKSAENARLKAPVSDEEKKRWNQNAVLRKGAFELVDALIASRAKGE